MDAPETSGEPLFGPQSAPSLRERVQEGLVDSRPRQGGVVSDVALTSVREIVEIRAGLEGLAARFASDKITELELAAMRAHLQRMRALTEAGAVSELVGANTAFHNLIRSAAHNHFVSTFVATIGPFDRSVRRAALGYPDEAERGYHEHFAIAEALQRRAGGLAEQMMRSHVMRTVRFVIDRAESTTKASP